MKHKRIGNSLDSFKLYYEDLERKTVKTATSKSKVTPKATQTEAKAPKVSLKTRIGAKLQPISNKFNNIKKRLGLQRKKAKKLTKTERSLVRQQKIRGIIGIGLLFVVVSIAYSTYMTVLFVDGKIMVAALAPQVIFAAITLLIAFYKIYK